VAVPGRGGWIAISNTATPKQATQFFSEQIQKNPHDSMAYFARGNARDASGEIAEALRDYDEAIRLNPTDAMSFNNRAAMYMKMHESAQALADLDEAVRLNPELAIAYLNRSAYWVLQGDDGKAIDEATKSLQLEPTPMGFLERGRIWADRKEIDKAIEDFTEAIKLNPKWTAPLLNRSEMWMWKRDYAKALDDLSQIVQIEPRNAESWQQLALERAGCPDPKVRDLKRAVKEAKRACELTQWKQSSSLSALAAIYADSKDFEQAVKWQAKAVEAASEDDPLTSLKFELEWYKEQLEAGPDDPKPENRSSDRN
jgi:tetratricopeptide (TPR) repeat protein